MCPAGTARPVPHVQFWERPDSCAAPCRGRGHAWPVSHVQFWGRPDSCTRPVGNAFMRSEIRRFVPVPTVPHVCRFYLLLTGEVPRRGGGREKTGNFCRKKFCFSGFSNLARQSRSSVEHSKTRPISPSAAPPQLPRQEARRPGRAAERAGVGAFCWPLLLGRAWPVPYRVRRNGFGAFDLGGPVPAERGNVFPTGPGGAAGGISGLPAFPQI